MIIRHLSSINLNWIALSKVSSFDCGCLSLFSYDFEQLESEEELKSVRDKSKDHGSDADDGQVLKLTHKSFDTESSHPGQSKWLQGGEAGGEGRNRYKRRSKTRIDRDQE
jgi:hypothetical protein